MARARTQRRARTSGSCGGGGERRDSTKNSHISVSRTSAPAQNSFPYPCPANPAHCLTVPNWTTRPFMIPATCQTCAPSPNDSTSGSGLDGQQENASPNLKVILGVLGGMALTAVVVFVSVPCVRWYKRRHPRSLGDVESSSGSRRTRWGLGSGRGSGGSGGSGGGRGGSGGDGEKAGLGDGGVMKPLLLPHIAELSSFTWSSAQRSLNSSAESVRGGVGDVDDMDVVDVYSLPTNDATLSHRSASHNIIKDYYAHNYNYNGYDSYNSYNGNNNDGNKTASDHPYSVLGGPRGSATARGGSRTQVSPSAKRSTSPPGLPPKSQSQSQSNGQHPSSRWPYNLIDHHHHTPTPDPARPIPITVDATTTTHTTTPTTNTPNNTNTPPTVFANTTASPFPPPHAPSPSPSDMQHPVSEGSHSHRSSKLGASTRPASLQLPSPPASPPHHLLSQSPLPSLSRSRSTAQSHPHSHSRSNSNSQQQLADWRFATQRAARPPLSGTHSAPTALPFRPPPSNAAAPTSAAGAWWSSPVSQHPSSSSSAANAPPLTSAFRTPLQRSNSQSSTGPSELTRNPSTLTKSPSPIPEASVYPISSRVRSPSVASERPQRVPAGARPRPVDMLRQENSGGSSRASRRASMPVTPSSILPPSSYVSTPSPVGDEQNQHEMRRAYLRSNSSLQTPQIEEPPPTPEGQSVAPSYFDRRPHLPQQQSSSSSSRTPTANPLTSPQSHSTEYAYTPSPSLGLGSRRASISSAIVPGPSSSRSAHHTNKPALGCAPACGTTCADGLRIVGWPATTTSTNITAWARARTRTMKSTVSTVLRVS
ncbi:hypothetical protein BDW22DRAFT_1207572 [Trametopsis cervina]|nr:hypothetical protein BDW22DRAFT_1207572 [Trametopsis cervina]